MALYPVGGYPKQTGGYQKWIYLVIILILGGGIIAVLFGFNPFKKTQKPPESASAANSSGSPATQAGKTSNIPTSPINTATAQSKQSLVPAVTNEPNLLNAPQIAQQSDPQAVQLINDAAECLSAKPPRIIEARDKLNKALTLPLSVQQLELVRAKLSELADEWLFSKKIFPEDKLCSSYPIKPGDSLIAIGTRFNVPYMIIQQINQIPRPELIKNGETIKVINGPFIARIYRSTYKLDLYLKNTFVKSFTVGLGKPGHETPTGLWLVKVGGKLEKPTWTDPDTGRVYKPNDPDYPLGSRWIGLEGIEGNAKGRTGFAIHGTQKPEEIGSATSRGCIRLHNGNAILMYNVLVEGQSKVIVED
jgi:LysM repeat protein